MHRILIQGISGKPDFQQAEYTANMKARYRILDNSESLIRISAILSEYLENPNN